MAVQAGFQCIREVVWVNYAKRIAESVQIRRDCLKPQQQVNFAMLTQFSI